MKYQTSFVLNDCMQERKGPRKSLFFNIKSTATVKCRQRVVVESTTVRGRLCGCSLYVYMRSKDTFGMMRALLDLFEVGFGGEDYDDNEDLY